MRPAAALTVALSGMTPAQRERLGGIYDNRALFCNCVVLPTVDGGTGAAWTILSPRLEAERSGVRYGLVNESTRLNLAALLEWDRETPGAAKETLMRLPGMTSVMADSLLDWIDLDEATRPGSAGFGKTLGQIYKFGELCRKAGITLLYHNHDFEFCTISGEYGLDFIYDVVPADVLKTEIDCCWVKYSGIVFSLLRHGPSSVTRISPVTVLSGSTI